VNGESGGMWKERVIFYPRNYSGICRRNWGKTQKPVSIVVLQTGFKLRSRCVAASRKSL
jgi:hypothetical protein